VARMGVLGPYGGVERFVFFLAVGRGRGSIAAAVEESYGCCMTVVSLSADEYQSQDHYCE
jgi:hypothetical protein